jgi:hypothetical protein
MKFQEVKKKVWARPGPVRELYPYVFHSHDAVLAKNFVCD